jgi:16S rRNA (guanine966-N2)-methyltransferase
MRVVGGSLGGRPLLAPRGWTVRPTSERAREAIFSALGDVAGLRVADLYCGTGAMAIEAISRGAASAVMVDRETRPALGNLRSLGIDDRVELIRSDVPEWVGGSSSSERFDLVFIDPPWRDWEALDQRLGAGMAGILRAGGRVVAESGTRFIPAFDSLEKVRERRYGRTLITFHQHPSSDES